MATKSRLAETEADLFKLQSPNHGAIQPWGSFDFQSVSPPARTYGSPFNNSEVGSFASSATTLVWVETKKDQPVQMHVDHSDDMQVISNRQLEATFQKRDFTSSKSDAAYVFQLDVVIVAMEFVLKYV